MTKDGTAWVNYAVYPMHLAIVDNQDDLNAIWDHLDINEQDRHLPSGKATTFNYINHKSGHIASVVFLSDKLSWNPYSVAGVAAHEAMHVVQDLWNHIGERKPGAEAEAYLLQSIVDEIMTFIEEKHPHRKRKVKTEQPIA